MTKGVSINVASSSQNPTGRGPVYPSDFSFEYLPIPEENETIEKVPTYAELEWITQENITTSDKPVHLDPEFETYTYGHAERGFGDINSLMGLEEGDYLFFHSTLDNKHDPSEWLTAIIGYFEIEKVIDCREFSSSEIKEMDRFENNAHLKRKDSGVDLLISGTEDSKLLEKCIPLSSFEDSRKLRDEFKELVRTPTGKKINDGSPWFRWTLKVTEPEKILEMR